MFLHAGMPMVDMLNTSHDVAVVLHAVAIYKAFWAFGPAFAFLCGHSHIRHLMHYCNAILEVQLVRQVTGFFWLCEVRLFLALRS